MRAALRNGFEQLVAELQERLSSTQKNGKAGRLYGSRVENLRTFLELFDAKNISQDDGLSQIVQRAKGLLDGVTVDDYRDDSRLRARAASAFEAVVAEVRTLKIKDAPRRKFRLGDEDAA